MRFRLGLWVLVLGPALPAAAATRTYVIDASASAVQVHVGKSGVFGFAGHTHEVTADRFEGRVDADPDDLARSSVELSFEASGLTVSAQGEPVGDAPKVQEVLAGSKVLDVSRFPAIRFRSRQVSGRRAAEGAYELQVAGEVSLLLSIHGIVDCPSHAQVVERWNSGVQEEIRHRSDGIDVYQAGVLRLDLVLELRRHALERDVRATSLDLSHRLGG